MRVDLDEAQEWYDFNAPLMKAEWADMIESMITELRILRDAVEVAQWRADTGECHGCSKRYGHHNDCPVAELEKME